MDANKYYDDYYENYSPDADSDSYPKFKRNHIVSSDSEKKFSIPSYGSLNVSRIMNVVEEIVDNIDIDPNKLVALDNMNVSDEIQKQKRYENSMNASTKMFEKSPKMFKIKCLKMLQML